MSLAGAHFARCWTQAGAQNRAPEPRHVEVEVEVAPRPFTDALAIARVPMTELIPVDGLGHHRIVGDERALPAPSTFYGLMPVNRNLEAKERSARTSADSQLGFE